MDFALLRKTAIGGKKGSDFIVDLHPDSVAVNLTPP